MANIELTIAIGSLTETYVLAKVSAPRVYDHGSAIEVHDCTYRDPKTEREIIERFILIPTRDVTWQSMRNRSGLHSFITDPDELLIEADDVARVLWTRLTASKEAA